MRAKERSGWIRVITWSTLFLTSLSILDGQTQINLGTQGRNVDFTNAPYTKPIRSGGALPSQCSAGEFFFNTGAIPGQNLFACLGATWTMMAAGNGLSDPGANGLLKRTGVNTTTAVPAPNGTLVGTTDVQTLTGKSIDASEVNSGVLNAARMPALTGDITSTSGSTATALPIVLSNPGTFGDGSHAVQITVDSKGRVTSASTVQIAAASGGSTNSVSNSVSAVTSGALNAIPSSCSTGALYFSTDQPAGQQLYVCSASNTWSQSLSLGNSGALAFTNGSIDIVTSVMPRLAAANHFTGSNQLDGTTTLSNVNITGSCTGCNSTGFANPMTLLGDQIVGGANGVATRAAVGAPGQIWTVGSAGQPVWASPAQSGTTDIYGSSVNYPALIEANSFGGEQLSISSASLIPLYISASGSETNAFFHNSGGNGFDARLQVTSTGITNISAGSNLQNILHYDPTVSGTPLVGTQSGWQVDTTGLTQPACDTTHRGLFWPVFASTGSADSLQFCAQTTGGFAWKAISLQ